MVASMLRQLGGNRGCGRVLCPSVHAFSAVIKCQYCTGTVHGLGADSITIYCVPDINGHLGVKSHVNRNWADIFGMLVI